MILNPVERYVEKKGIEKGIEKGIKKGIEKGIEKGRAEGEIAERLKNAKNLKINGVPIEVIAKSLGLSQEEIEKL